MEVSLVKSDRGTLWEPTYDPHWDDMTKLQWRAGQASFESGLMIEVRSGTQVINEPNPEAYTVSVNGDLSTVPNFKVCWFFLAGISMGATATK